VTYLWALVVALSLHAIKVSVLIALGHAVPVLAIVGVAAASMRRRPRVELEAARQAHLPPARARWRQLGDLGRAWRRRP
jgi:hypothetical protein